MSVAHQRAIKGYPCTKYYRLFKAYFKIKEQSASEGLEMVIKAFFDKMPEKEHKILLDYYKRNFKA